MSTSQSSIQTFNFRPKLCSFQVDGTPANFMITMGKKRTNKVSAPVAKKRLNLLAAFIFGLERKASTLRAAYTQQRHGQPEQAEGKLTQWSYLLFWLTYPYSPWLIPRKLSDIHLSQICFPVILFIWLKWNPLLPCSFPQLGKKLRLWTGPHHLVLHFPNTDHSWLLCKSCYIPASPNSSIWFLFFTAHHLALKIWPKNFTFPCHSASVSKFCCCFFLYQMWRISN